MSCVSIGHDCLGRYGKRAVKCIICADAHKVENYRCGVTGCIVKMGKICTHVTPKCANCRGNHQAIAFKYQGWLRAQAEVWSKKAKKPQVKDKRPAAPPALEETLDVRSTEMEVDTVSTLWTNNLEPQSLERSLLKDNEFESFRSETSEIYADESLNHSKKYQY